jgi:hypothetical protein
MTMHGIKRTAWRGIAATVLGVGALAFAAPTVALAQEAPQHVDKSQVPEKVRNARQNAAPQGSDVEWYRVTENGQPVYIAQFKGGGEGGKRREMRIAADGKVVREPGPASDLTAIAPAAVPAAGAAAGATEEEQLRYENERLNAELDRLRAARDDEKTIQSAQGKAGKAQSPEVRARRQKEAEQRTKSLATREQALTERQRQIQTRLDAIASSRATERSRLSAAERDRLTEQDRLIADKVKTRREEERARLAREEDLADDRLGAGGAANANVRYRGIPAEDVPDSVRAALDKYTRGMEDVRYRRELSGDDISYSAHYVNPRENKRYWVSINEDGTVNSAPRPSIYQPGTDNDVRLASGRKTGAGAGADATAGDEIRHTDIARADVPRRALAALEKHTTGAKDLQFRREERAGGKTTYSVRYMQPNDKRYYVAVDESGNTVIEPRISAVQPGDKR